MNTTEVIVTEICGTALLLGAGGLAVIRQALKDGWVTGGVSLRLVEPRKRHPQPDVPESTAAALGGTGLPAAVAAPLKDGRRVA